MKKVLMFISMFLFITNVSALTFDVNLTNIEDKGNNGTMGSITNIDIPNKTLDTLFQDIGDEVSFDLTITNSGDRAGTLRSITITSSNDKIEYIHNLPTNGLAINGNDYNTVTITSKVLQGAVNGTSSSVIKITYNYDEGSCPEGEILSEDESMCLCPEGMERNEFGVCVNPPKQIDCEEDEIYNEEKKICEKKEIPVIPDDPVKPTPVTPSNPKTLDNIILITLLFLVSGLGIYAVMFKRLQTKQNKIIAGVITGVITLGASFTVLVTMTGLDNLLGSIINPVTKSKEIEITVNETIEMVETWNGNCSTNSYAPGDVFEGGSGTEADPYTIKTANQLACFAESVNDGNTYEGKFIKQIKNIKLNDNLVEGSTSGGYGFNEWTPAGQYRYNTYFAGTYDGDNHSISGLLLTNDSGDYYSTKGLFGYAKGATFKNLTLSDTFIDTSLQITGALLGKAFESLTIDNITTNGIYSESANTYGGIVGEFSGYEYDKIPITENEFVLIENSTNNISPVSAGIIGRISLATNKGVGDYGVTATLRNVTNNGTIKPNNRETVAGGIVGAVSITNYTTNGNSRGLAGVLSIENAVNNGNIEFGNTVYDYGYAGGIAGAINSQQIEIKNSHNVGNISSLEVLRNIGGLTGYISNFYGSLTIDNCYNSGNISLGYDDSYSDGLTDDEVTSVIRYNNRAVGGLLGEINTNNDATNIIKDSYNTGDIKANARVVGGIVAYLLQSEILNDDPGWNFTIQDSYNTGDLYDVTGSVAGIAGLYGGTISGCHNSGKIVQAGKYYNYDIYVGGLLGNGGTDLQFNNDGTIIDSYNEGEILVTAKTYKVYTAGICVRCRTITDSHNSGNITSLYAATVFEGLYVPDPDEVVTVTNSYNEGTITPGPGY